MSDASAAPAAGSGEAEAGPALAVRAAGARAGEMAAGEVTASEVGAGEARAGEAGMIRNVFGLDEAAFESLIALITRSSTPATVEAVKRIDQGVSFGAALGLSEDVIAHLYGQAFHAFNAGRHRRAEDLFRALCILAGDVADHWLGYGVCLRLREAFEPARLACRNAAALRPDWAVPQFHLLEIAIREEAYEEARERFAALAHRPEELPEGMARELHRFGTALRTRAAAEGTP